MGRNCRYSQRISQSGVGLVRHGSHRANRVRGRFERRFDDDYFLLEELFLREDARFLDDVLFFEDVLFFDADFFFDGLRGTFAPALRASERPIAIACLRLFTFFPERPLLSVPRFFSCIAFLTLLFAFGPYLAAMWSLLHAVVEQRHSRRVAGCPSAVSV